MNYSEKIIKIAIAVSIFIVVAFVGIRSSYSFSGKIDNFLYPKNIQKNITYEDLFNNKIADTDLIKEFEKLTSIIGIKKNTLVDSINLRLDTENETFQNKVAAEDGFTLLKEPDSYESKERVFILKMALRTSQGNMEYIVLK